MRDYNIDKIRKIYTSNVYDYDNETWSIEDIYVFYDESMEPVKVPYDPAIHGEIVVEFLEKKGIDPSLEECVELAVQGGLIERVDVEDDKTMADLEAMYLSEKESIIASLNDKDISEKLVSGMGLKQKDRRTADEVVRDNTIEKENENIQDFIDRTTGVKSDRTPTDLTDEYAKLFANVDNRVDTRTADEVVRDNIVEKENENIQDFIDRTTGVKNDRTPVDRENELNEAFAALPSGQTVPKPRERGIFESDSDYEKYLSDFYSGNDFINTMRAINPSYTPALPSGKREMLPSGNDVKNVPINSESKEEKKEVKVPTSDSNIKTDDARTIVPPVKNTKEVATSKDEASKEEPKVKVTSPVGRTYEGEPSKLQSDLTKDEEEAIDAKFEKKNDEDEIKPKNVRFGRIKAWAKRIGLVALGVISGIAGFNYFKNRNNKNTNDSNVKDTPIVQQQTNTNINSNTNNVQVNQSASKMQPLKMNMSAKDAYHQLKGTQSKTFYKAYRFMSDIYSNTDQMSFEEFSARVQNGQEINFRLLEDGDNTLNFTVDEIIATIAVMNNYGPEELAQLYYGENINTETIMSNFEQFYKKVSVYYMNATEPLGILENFIDESNTKAREFWNRLESSLIACNKEIKATGTLSTKTSDQFIRDAYYSYMYENAYANDDDIDPAVSFLASAMVEAYTLTNRNVTENLYLHETLESDRALTGGIEVGVKLQQLRTDEMNDIAGIENVNISNETGIIDAINDEAYCNKVEGRLNENVLKTVISNSVQSENELITALAENGRTDAIQYIRENGVTETLLNSLSADPILASSVEAYREGSTIDNAVQYSNLREFLETNGGINPQITDIADLVNRRTRAREMELQWFTTVTSHTTTTTTTKKEEVDYNSLSGDEKKQADEAKEKLDNEIKKENKKAENKKEMNEMEHEMGSSVVEEIGNKDNGFSVKENEDGGKTVVATDKTSGKEFEITNDVADAIFQAQVNGDKETVEKIKDEASKQYQEAGISKEEADARADELANATESIAKEEAENRKDLYEEAQKQVEEANKRAEAESKAQQQKEMDEINALINAGNGSSNNNNSNDGGYDKPTVGEDEIPVLTPDVSVNSNGETKKEEVEKDVVVVNESKESPSEQTSSKNESKESPKEEKKETVPEEVDYSQVNNAEEEVVVSHDPVIVEQAINEVVSEMAAAEIDYIEPEEAGVAYTK